MSGNSLSSGETMGAVAIPENNLMKFLLFMAEGDLPADFTIRPQIRGPLYTRLVENM